MRICFMYGAYPGSEGASGVAAYAQVVARQLVQLGHEVTVVAFATASCRKCEEDQGVFVLRVPFPSWHWYLYKTPFLGPRFVLAAREMERSWRLYRVVRELHAERPFDIVEGTETGAFLLALYGTIPLCIRLHADEYTFRKYTGGDKVGLREESLRIIQRLALHRAQLLTSPSRSHAKEIHLELGKSHPPIRIIPNPLTSICLYNSTAKCIDSTSSQTPCILMVARLQRVKGIDVLLAAVPFILPSFPQAQFIIAGPNHPSIAQEELDYLALKLGITDNVRFLGQVNQPTLSSLYRNATMCVLSSYYESFGLTALEAMAYSIPVVATKVGGLPEVVEDGETGLLVPPGDPVALATAISTLLGNPDLRQKMGQKGRLRAFEQFGVDHIVDLTLQAYRDCIASARADP